MSRVQIILLLVLLSGGSFLYFAATQNGIAISPDSVTYLDTARSINAGQGLTAYGEPMVHYPPLYPLALAAVSIGMHDALASARWLNYVLLLINVFLLYMVILEATEKCHWAALLSAAFFITSRSTLMLHTFAWSEPLFIAFCLLSCLLLMRVSATRGSGIIFLLGLVSGMAINTRIIGLVLVPVIGLCLLWLERGSLRRGLQSLLFYAAIALLVIAPVVVRNFLILDQASNRNLVLHLVAPSELIQMVSNAHNFLMPETLSYPVKILEIGILLAMMVWMLKVANATVRNDRQPIGKRMATLFGLLFALMMTAALLLSVSIFDASTPLDARIMYPVFLFIVIALLILAFSDTAFKSSIKPFAIAVLVFASITNLTSTIPYVRQLPHARENYMSTFWDGSATMTAIERLSSQPNIISNGFDLIKVRTWRNSQPPPQKVYRDTLQVNDAYAHELGALCGPTDLPHTVVVFFDALQRPEYAGEADFVAACPGAQQTDMADGAFFAP